MTLHELLDEVKSFTSTAVPEPQVIAMLNRAMVRISRDLGIPRVHLDVNNVTTEFSLTTSTVGYDVREVLSAYRDDEAGTHLPLHSGFEANRLHPGWRNWDEGETQFLVYDPATLGLGTATLLPVPVPPEDEPESYVLTCVVRPSEMSALSDEPFEGLIPEYHQMLVHFVAGELLIMVGDSSRAEFHRGVYEELKREAYMYARPDGAVFRPGRFAPFGGSWRDE